jgi:hypothetical protein
MCVIFLNFIDKQSCFASVILRMKIIYVQEIYILKFEYLIIIKLKNTTTVENSPIQSKIVDRGDTPNRLTPPTVLELYFNILQNVYTHNGGLHVKSVLILIKYSQNYR